MTIDEMHILFRAIGQQMGMEDIRVILPKTIDVLINDAITEKVNSILINHTNIAFKDKFSNKAFIQSNEVSPINALRTLYKEKSISFEENNNLEKIILDINKALIYTSFDIKYIDDNRIYNCRLIEGDELADTLNDYLNSASWQYPIVSMFSDENDAEYLKLFINSKSHIPNTLIVKYIVAPNVVKWDENVNNRVDCNLPNYLHNDIVNMAVNKFFASLNATK